MNRMRCERLQQKNIRAFHPMRARLIGTGSYVPACWSSIEGGDGQTGSKCVGPGRLDQKLRTYDSLFPALMHGNLIVVTYPGCGYCFAGSPTRIPTARNIEGAPVPNRDDEHLGARILTKFLTQTTRRVHRLAAILLRRWQAEEIAKTPFPACRA